MGLVDVDVVGLQASKRIFASFNDVFARVGTVVDAFVANWVIHLGCQNHIITSPTGFEGPTNYFFALAGSITVGGVDQIDTVVYGTVDNVDRLVFRSRVGEVVCAQANGRNFKARATERSVKRFLQHAV